MHIFGGIEMGRRDLIKKTKIVPFINVGTSENPEWMRIKKSTSFTLATNPQTKTFDFISSDHPEEEIDSYQPSLAQSITMFKGEDDYQHIFDMLYELPTGAEAHRDVLIAFYQEEATLKGEKEVTREVTKVSYVPTEDTEIDQAKTYYVKDGDEYAAVETPDAENILEYYERTETTETETVTEETSETVYKAWKIDALVKVNQMDTVNETIDFDLGFGDIERGAVTNKGGKVTFVKGTFENGIFTAA